MTRCQASWQSVDEACNASCVAALHTPDGGESSACALALYTAGV